MQGTSIILFCSCLLSILTISFAADSIVANQTLSDGETIISAQGEFEMGFFSTSGIPSIRYFGIWYKKISEQTVVWVGNRDTPFASTSGIIKVTRKGIVVSTDKSTDGVIWSSNYSRSVNNPVAQLLDTGNLVFRDENDKQNFVWQSFDHPVDNLLPGMKLGFNFRTGIDSYFSPWKSVDDPSPGNYILRIEPNGFPQLILYKDSAVWYRTGPWLGSRFSDQPFLRSNRVYTERFVIDETEVYYSFDLVNSSQSPITRLALAPTGDSRRLIWNGQNQVWVAYLTSQVGDCGRYGSCGTNGVCNVNKSPRICTCLKGFHPDIAEDWDPARSNGCSRNVKLQCGNGDGFLKYAGLKLPDTRWSWYNLSMNLLECEAKCSKDCNCTAYSNADIRNGGHGCLLWFGDLIDIQFYLDDGQDLYVRLAASELIDNRHKKQLLIKLVPALVVLTVLISFFLWYAYKTKRLKTSGKAKLNERHSLDLPLFNFIQISNATENFSDNNKLGKGGFGTVYKGILEDGQEIAVKRLSKDSRQGVNEFMNEVSCIAKLQHRNLVRLLGCCIEEGERLLIYEYLPNKSLDSFIFDKEMCQSLNWSKRYNIINGIARGLLYLHQDSRLRIIHRDLKASNILLDDEMNPKISDFGLARIFRDSETQASTTRVVGTHGYMPPEYAIDGQFSVKSDVYSFGVSLLEIVTGKRNRGFDHPDHNLNLIGHVWRSYNECKLLDVLDGVILESNDHRHEVFRTTQIGLLCVQENPKDRPNMSSTFRMLTSNDALPVPKQPGFFSERINHQETASSPRAFSLNTISVSFYAPRE
ncbi:Receptor-like serine/threonine-protein kinase [Heracleum sosnowskyi]|uniref:Receptor-like serine/threonine-protein kinase n=1 Tax=Heracleum sosnowskyi TaxID=360622 RepID=A0AAD8HLD2_9APIA|nr:Receptor-like serine/threonine-protein kinase [Heracleum sosnowskyi]